eukprot:CAMPEP_0115279688 /NCGR_PEP_ID=MMETSP0270-20121206/58393_1 /TAXON_ID=71861 /ORGANISM="Scrippsiella trochoidea, Strain CCMP3099" /LENGTH=86 /DNA_ID=CAMNT_0002696385 /DNA_START=614 /DNA_END=874 /DNA_ORIENTATION=+
MKPVPKFVDDRRNEPEVVDNLTCDLQPGEFLHELSSQTGFFLGGGDMQPFVSDARVQPEHLDSLSHPSGYCCHKRELAVTNGVGVL